MLCLRQLYLIRLQPDEIDATEAEPQPSERHYANMTNKGEFIVLRYQVTSIKKTTSFAVPLS
jgi:hypothetical protein